jgi:uncharacterized protein YkwD
VVGRRTFAALLVALTGAWISCMPVGPTTAATPVEQLLWRINEERGDRGLPGLQERGDVEQIAGDHSRDMSSTGRLEHNDAYFSDENRARLHARALGENVAYGPSIESAHRAFMESEGHRNNILDQRFAVVGLGAVWDGREWWVTEDFVQPR